MTKPLVSVIVPTFNSAELLEECLLSIQQQSYQPIELIVVDNNSQDNTKDIARRHSSQVYNQGPERSAQRNFGVKKSSGEYLLIIDSDMVLTPQVIESCVCKMMGNRHLKALVIPEESFGEGFWAQCKVLERSFYIGVSWMEASRFFCRKTFKEMGGYDEQNTGTEDFDLPQRIEKRYEKGAINRAEKVILHNEGRFSLFNTCKKKFYYAQMLDSYKTKPANRTNFGKQANILSRFALFFSKPKRLFHNPVYGLGMLVLKFCEFFAGGLGYLSASFGRKLKSRKTIYPSQEEV
jgi:glycosyltransferase involved in cell wall biosynthesis